MQLGHGGGTCPGRVFERDVKTITVLNTTGVHETLVMFCGCGAVAGNLATEVSQLLCCGWYPATKDRPKTVATFNLLDLYDSITSEGKLSAFHFYKSLTRLTGVTESDTVAVSFEWAICIEYN